MTHLDANQIPLRRANLIEASAGTGKTYTIVSLYLRLIAESGLGVDQILVVTFTEAATAELRARIRERLQEALEAVVKGRSGDEVIAAFLRRNRRLVRHRLQQALRSFDDAAVFTIHGFCRKILAEHAFESGIPFGLELVADVSALHREIAYDFWGRQLYRAPFWFADYLIERERVGPERLVPWIDIAASQPDLQLLPQEIDPFDLERYLEVYRQTREQWQTHETEIRELLRTHAGLRRRSYTRPNLARWLDQVDRFFEPTEPVLTPRSDRAGVDKFTTFRLAEKTEAGHPPPNHPFFEGCAELTRSFDRQRLAFYRHLVGYAGTELIKRKRLAFQHSFDDLLHQLDRALASTAGNRLVKAITERYRAALIDEFQDTDRVQYRIFNRLYGRGDRPFFVIGDPKQSIYGFRGADIFAYLEAVRNVEDRRYTLPLNWRSDPGLVAAVNTLFERVADPFIYPQIGFSPVAPRPGAVDSLTIDGARPAPLQFLFVSREEGPQKKGMLLKRWAEQVVADRVAADIAELLLSKAMIGAPRPKRVAPADIAVLVRKNRQAELIQQALRARGIPSVTTGSRSVLDTVEATELARVLAAVVHPADAGRLRAALGTELVGMAADDLDRLSEDDRAWERVVDQFVALQHRWLNSGIYGMIKRFLSFSPHPDGSTVQTRLLRGPSGERRLTNLLHLAELLQTHATAKHLGPTGLLRWFNDQRALDRQHADTVQLRLESDAGAVQLVTIFKAKGLEYPIVYCPFLFDGGSTQPFAKPSAKPVVFHDSSSGRATLDLGSADIDQHRKWAEQEEVAESLRLLYVALTRAVHLCRVVCGGIAGIERSALGLLLRPAEVMGDLWQQQQHLKSVTDDQLRATLDELGRLSGGAITTTDLRERDTVYAPPRHAPPLLTGRTPKQKPPTPRQLHSFTRLTASGGTPTPEQLAGRDRDELGRSASARAQADEGAATIAGASPLIPFDRGANAGNCFHEIFEHLDFAAADGPAVDQVITDTLESYGYDAQKWGPIVGQGIQWCLDTPLTEGDPQFTLRAIPLAHRLNELEFAAPVSEPSNERSPGLTAGGLAAEFERRASGAVPAGYAESVRQLGFSPGAGYLKGFVDLVFTYRDRFYLVDYKTNFLGPQPQHYDLPSMTAAMGEHHYFLQYHLYTVALYRYLRHRWSGFDYDRHFGQVFYLFVRGMSPKTGSRLGVFADRPSRELIEALSNRL